MYYHWVLLFKTLLPPVFISNCIHWIICSLQNQGFVYQHISYIVYPLEWRHNGLHSVSNHQPCHCLLNRLFRCRLKKTSKLRVTGHCAGNSPGPVNSPYKGPVTRKMVPFDDVIMLGGVSLHLTSSSICFLGIVNGNNTSHRGWFLP